MPKPPPPSHRWPLRPLLGAAALGLTLVFTASDTYAAAHGPLVPGEGHRLAAAELRGAVTTFWAVDPADPRRRSVLGQTEHAGGWGVRAQASPDGRFIAYTAFPQGRIEPTAESELWALNTATGAQRRLATGIDLLAAPRWSPDSTLVVARRTSMDTPDRTDGPSARSFALLGLRPDVTDGEPQTLATASGVEWAGAVGWREGALAYATIDGAGTWLRSSGSGDVLQLSNGIARDFSLAPDGGRLSFAEAPGPAEPTLRLATADLTTRQITPVNAPDGAFNPVWTPAGAITVGAGTGRTALQGSAAVLAAGGRTATVLRSLPGQFLAPLEWSPDGAVLAARLAGGTAERPTDDRLAVAGAAAGLARPLTFAGYAAFAGWLP